MKSVEELTPQQKFSENLRLVADWYDKHPKAPVSNTVPFFTIWNFNATASEIRAIGTSKKEYDDTFFKLVVENENFTLRFYAYRDKVCVRRVIDTKHVEAKYIPGFTIEPKLMPAHEEDVVIWECPGAILAAKK